MKVSSVLLLQNNSDIDSNYIHIVSIDAQECHSKAT